MGQQVEELARFVAQTRLEDIPEAVRAHARLVLLDTLGVILAGAKAAGAERAARALGSQAPAAAPRSTRAAGRVTTRAPQRCLNGIAGRSIELCEGLRLVSGQAAMQVLPGGARGRRDGGELGPRHADGLHPRLRCRRTARRRVHAAPAGASKRPGVAAGGGGGGRAPARPRCRRESAGRCASRRPCC